MMLRLPRAPTDRNVLQIQSTYSFRRLSSKLSCMRIPWP